MDKPTKVAESSKRDRRRASNARKFLPPKDYVQKEPEPQRFTFMDGVLAGIVITILSLGLLFGV